MSSFWRKWVAFALALAPATGLAAAPVWAQSSPAVVDCYAKISSPSNGGSVPLNGVVEGSSATYGNVSVWILTHRRGLGQWWPQNSGPVQGGAGVWSAKATYGTAQEAGKPFEIAAVPVDQRTSEGLAGWMVRANVYNESGGISLPRPAKGCRYNIVEVRRGD